MTTITNNTSPESEAERGVVVGCKDFDVCRLVFVFITRGASVAAWDDEDKEEVKLDSWEDVDKPEERKSLLLFVCLVFVFVCAAVNFVSRDCRQRASRSRSQAPENPKHSKRSRTRRH